MWRILLIHHDREFQRAQQAFWEDQGYEVSSAHDAAQAIEKLRSERPEVVVLSDAALQDEGDYEDAQTLGNEARKMGVSLVLVRESERGLAPKMNESVGDDSSAYRQKGS
jgi:DNA-binding response OmpR family regulator